MEALIVPSVTIRGAFFHNRLRPFRVRGVEIITTGYRIDARLNNQMGNKKTVMWKWIMQKRLGWGARAGGRTRRSSLQTILLGCYQSKRNSI